MEVTFASRAPARDSAGWQLQKKRPNEFGYVNEPIEARGRKSWERNIPDVVRKHLEGVDLTSIRPSELEKLANALHREGYVSHLAATQLGLITLDVKDHPQNMIAQMEDHLHIGVAANNPMYALGIAMDEAAVDAVHGMQAVALMLRAQSVDTYA
jgi:hypothetical protein